MSNDDLGLVDDFSPLEREVIEDAVKRHQHPYDNDTKTLRRAFSVCVQDARYNGNPIVPVEGKSVPPHAQGKMDSCLKRGF